jgi:hypothetical protein
LIVADIPAASADPLTKAVPFGSYTFSDKALPDSGTMDQPNGVSRGYRAKNRKNLA